jgi:hypothetical protein
MDYELRMSRSGDYEGRGKLRGPITPKQKAFLEYMGFDPPATKQAASDMITTALYQPAYQKLQVRWNDVKYRLHPDLYAEEIALLRIEHTPPPLPPPVPDDSARQLAVANAKVHELYDEIYRLKHQDIKRERRKRFWGWLGRFLKKCWQGFWRWFCPFFMRCWRPTWAWLTRVK